MLRPSADLEFVVAELEDNSGVRGAAALARAALLSPLTITGPRSQR